MSKLVTFILFFALAIVASRAQYVSPRDNPIPFTSCGNSSDIGVIGKILAFPWPPIAGEDLTLWFEGYAYQDISNGTYKARVMWHDIPLWSEAGPLDSVTKLPISGPFIMTYAATLPKALPQGPITLIVDAFNQTSAEIVCVNININL